MKKLSFFGGVVSSIAALAFLSAPVLCGAARAQIAAKADAPFINTWLVAGTFANDAQNSGYEKDWIGETQARPQIGAASGGATWRYFDDRLFSRNYDDYQDLFSYFKTKRSESVAAKIAYAHVYIHSAEAQNAQLRVGADNQFKAWLNGALVAGSTQGLPRRDMEKKNVSLQVGWNRLLFKIANQEEGRFGFYARLSDDEGRELPGLTYSIGDETNQKLSITTQAMTDAATGVLPVGYREWSYVAARPPYDEIERLGKIEDTYLETFVTNRAYGAAASDFVLSAQGGSAPYRWTLSKGALPPGLKLMENGIIGGTIAFKAALREYSFEVQVRDAKGATASAPLSILVRERPNKWYEEARLSALIHGPNALPVDEIDDHVQIMKREGYRVVIPIGYNNGGQFFFMYQSALGVPEKLPAHDYVALYKKALDEAGIDFGMYFGNVDYKGDPNVSPNRGVLLLEEALVKYRPRIFWFDWGSQDSVSLDAIYSMIKSRDPEALVLSNGVSNGTQGDWDVICFESITVGDAGWNEWPTDLPWFKKHAGETWRFIPDPADPNTVGVSSDWRDTARMMISIIGEGFIANIDNSPYSVGPTKTIYDLPRIKTHQKIADWASPPNLPPLHASYTRVNKGPLPDAAWGYNTINLQRDTIYLHLMQNPRGKTGMPASGVLQTALGNAKVKSVTWMNAGKPVPFSVVGKGDKAALRLDLKAVKPDSVSTILAVKLAAPLPPQSAPVTKYAPLKITPRQLPPGNLASFKPSRFLGNDGVTPLLSVPTRYPSRGNDGSVQTFAFARGEWQWIYEVDLQERASISRVVAHFRDELFPTEFEIDVSLDGKTWTNVARQTTDKGGEYILRFAPTEARWVRVHQIKPDGPNQKGILMGVREFGVYER